MAILDYCFDTSGINRFHDDPDREFLMAGIFASGRVLITAPNVAESAITNCESRRNSLIKFMYRLARNFRPLRLPPELVKEITIARHEGRSTTLTVGEKGEGLWVVLNDPSVLGDEGQQEAYDWQQKYEGEWAASHREARPEFEKAFSGMEIPTTFGKFLRSCVKNQNGYSDSVAMFYSDCTGVNPDADQVRKLLTDVPEWRLYLGGWAQGMYAQGIQPQNYGPNRNAGTVDLWCAVYLQHCDFFITDDGPQRRALRVLNVLSSRKPRARVLSYDQFRSRFILSPMK